MFIVFLLGSIACWTLAVFASTDRNPGEARAHMMTAFLYFLLFLEGYLK